MRSIRLWLPIAFATGLCVALGCAATATSAQPRPTDAIVFTRPASHGGPPALYLLAPAGSVRRLAANAAEPAVAVGGKRIAFVRDDAIWVMRRDGSEQRRLTHPRRPQTDGTPAWSADGGTVYFSRGADRGRAIFLVRADGSGLRRLTRLPPPGSIHDFLYEDDPQASPDGRIVAFNAETIGPTAPPRSIAAVSVTGRDVHLPFRFPPETMAVFDPAWAPDGRTLAYCSAAFEPPFRGGLHLASADGSPARRIAPCTAAPAWSPDGRWIAFVRQRRLWLIRADGFELRPLAPRAAADPAWLPRS